MLVHGDFSFFLRMESGLLNPRCRWVNVGCCWGQRALDSWTNCGGCLPRMLEGRRSDTKTVRDGVRVADSPPELLALANVRQKADSRCRRFLRRVRHRNDKIIGTGQRWHAVPGVTSGYVR